MEYFAFQFHITDSCDQRCEHCYIFSKHNQKPIVEMPFEDVKKVIDNALSMCKKMNRQPYFYITGGDPILHTHFWEILAYLKENKIDFGILGNPFHLSDEVCKRLASFGCKKYQLSLDGLKGTHDKIRKTGSFDCTISKIKCIRDAGMYCAVMTTVSQTNIKEIPKLVDIVVKNNVDVFTFARYCPTEDDRDIFIEPNDYKKFLDKMQKKFEKYEDSNTYFQYKDHLWNLYFYEKGEYDILKKPRKGKYYDGCNLGNCHITILPKGQVYACRRFDSPIGNALTDDLYGIFFGEKMSCYRDWSKFEKCSKCELLQSCRGCPAVAYGHTGSFYGADPQCWKKL